MFYSLEESQWAICINLRLSLSGAVMYQSEAEFIGSCNVVGEHSSTVGNVHVGMCGEVHVG